MLPSIWKITLAYRQFLAAVIENTYTAESEKRRLENEQAIINLNIYQLVGRISGIVN